MATIQKIKLIAYTDDKYISQHGSLELPLDPDHIKFGNTIRYSKDKQLGTTGGNIAFEGYEPESLQLKFTVDCTGVVEGTKKEDKTYDKVQAIEDVLYVYNNDSHSPSYVKLIYGQMLFKGRLASMQTDTYCFP